MKSKNQKFLKTFVPELVTAYFYDYTRQLPQSVLLQIQNILTEETGDTQNFNLSCGNCIVRMLKMAARMYFTENQEDIPDDLKNRFKL